MSRTPLTDVSSYRPSAALSRWLSRLARLDPGRMVLGLERIATVYAMLGAELDVPTYVVAGTNGKGSCVHLLDALLAAQGHRVGRYTSPHLVHFRERIYIGGEPVDDDRLVAAFERVANARGDIELSYFEFATLAAFEAFRTAEVSARVLEIGLGGRLDAVNVVAATGALLTNVGLDHQRWLGETREAIGHEKAGVFRRERPAVVATRDVPDSVMQQAQAVAADLRLLGRDFDAAASPDDWVWRGASRSIAGLDASLDAPMRDNASACLALLEATGQLPDDDGVVRVSVARARAPARLEVVPGAPEVLLDVAHNGESVQRLRAWLDRHPVDGGNTLILGVMGDKAVDAMIGILAPAVSRWVAVAAPGTRPMPATDLAQRIAQVTGTPAIVAGSPVSGWRLARQLAERDGRVVAAGSFPVVGAIRAEL